MKKSKNIRKRQIEVNSKKSASFFDQNPHLNQNFHMEWQNVGSSNGCDIFEWVVVRGNI